MARVPKTDGSYERAPHVLHRAWTHPIRDERRVLDLRKKEEQTKQGGIYKRGEAGALISWGAASRQGTWAAVGWVVDPREA